MAEIANTLNSMTGTQIVPVMTAEAKVKSFLDYGGLQIYTQEIQAWAGEALTKFEYTQVDTLPEIYISDEKQPRYIYMYDNNSDGTQDLYMYLINTDPDAPSGTTYKLTNIGSIALKLEDYYTKAEIEGQLQGYVNKEDDDYKETKQLAAKAASDAATAIEKSASAEAAAIGAAGTASSAQAAVTALASKVAKLEQGGVGGGCDCTAIEGASIRSLFATLD